MATWKKVIVSGSTAELANIQNAGISANQVVIGAGAGADQTGEALSAGQVLMGNGSSVPTGTSISGDITLANDGEVSIGSDKVTTAMLSGSATDTPQSGDVIKVGANGAFTFDTATSVLSAGKGITITKNKISSSIANSDTSYGTANSTEFTGSFKGPLDGTAGVASTVTITDNESTNESNAIVFAAGGTHTGDLGLESDGDLTYNPSTGGVTATEFTGSLKGNVDGNLNGTVGAIAAASGKFTTLEASGNVTLGDSTGDTVTIAGDLIVQGNTTEVQTTNLNVKDALILLSSGSQGSTKKDSGIVFSGNNIGVSLDQSAVNSGSALFVDSGLKRLSVTADAAYVGASATDLTPGGFIPLVTTGSQTSYDQVGNFKVDNSGDLFVYAG